MRTGRSAWASATALLVATTWSGALAAPADDVERWGVFELELPGPTGGNLFVDVELSAEFRAGDRVVRVSGFYDGEGVYRVRFMPDELGEWTYRTKSNRAELAGKSGSLSCVAPSEGNHGPVRVYHKFHFEYADGTRYHQIGTTCYAWVHQPETLQEETLRTLAKAPFNKMRMCVFPKSYTYNKNEPELFAYEKGADGKFDHTRFSPAFWRHFERRVGDLGRLGIEADLILWHPYDRWGFATMAAGDDDRYLRYAIARLAAFRNVWWSLANEFDLMQPNVRGHRGNKAMADWDRFFRILQTEDPYGRLRGIHNCREFYDHTKSWVTHASIQRHDLPKVFEWRAQFSKPVVIDECGYEGNVPQGWGSLSAQEMVQRFWIGTARGGYVGHGETYLHPEDILWWSKGGVLHGESPARIAFLKKIVDEAPFREMVPGEELAPGVYPLSRDGEYHLVYFANPGKVSFRLTGERGYKIDGIDTWGMRVRHVGSAEPGTIQLEAPVPGYLVRLVAYRLGEARRPDARASATPREGVAPLAVRFDVHSDITDPGEVRWDFGDGDSSSERQPLHTYRKPGVYMASVTLTAANGQTVDRLLSVAVDRSTTTIVRALLPENESQSLRFSGPVERRQDGSVHLGDGEPWKWISVGDGPLDDLRGLRAFTILGWVKPESLAIGSGGNRLVLRGTLIRETTVTL